MIQMKIHSIFVFNIVKLPYIFTKNYLFRMLTSWVQASNVSTGIILTTGTESKIEL